MPSNRRRVVRSNSAAAAAEALNRWRPADLFFGGHQDMARNFKCSELSRPMLASIHSKKVGTPRAYQDTDAWSARKTRAGDSRKCASRPPPSGAPFPVSGDSRKKGRWDGQNPGPPCDAASAGQVAWGMTGDAGRKPSGMALLATWPAWADTRPCSARATANAQHRRRRPTRETGRR
jgi:hypothetical protein